MTGAIWSFRVTEYTPDRSLEIEGRAGHLGWRFAALAPFEVTPYDRGHWLIEANHAAVAEGIGMVSVPLAVALVVEALAPYLVEVGV